jgi:alkylation response protein AidB-like acyl-CoA dehydrogenase
MLAPERNAEALEMERMILDTVRRITADKVAPRAAEIDATGKYPQDIRDIFAENELFSVPFPEEYGGLGSFTTYVKVVEEVSTSVTRTTRVSSSAKSSTKWASKDRQLTKSCSPNAVFRPTACSASKVRDSPSR